MTKPFEIYAPFFPDRSACVVAIKSSLGFCISRQQFLHAKRKLKVPDWSTVFLRRNCVAEYLTVISDNPDYCEVIKCAS